MNRGLTLKCLQCDNHEFHILYEMGSQPGGVPHPRQSGTYECVHCGHVADAAEQEATVAKIQQERRPMNRERRTIQSPKSDGDSKEEVLRYLPYVLP